MIYAGIGSRSTPYSVLNVIEKIAKVLAENNWVLRSGGASGADHAFETGCDHGTGNKEIYLPWPGFNENSSTFTGVSANAMNIASNFHPNWSNLSTAVKKLMGRNTMQILGNDLRTPADLVICWTPNGKREGGTGQALRIASYYDIRIVDLGLPEVARRYTHLDIDQIEHIHVEQIISTTICKEEVYES